MRIARPSLEVNGSRPRALEWGVSLRAQRWHGQPGRLGSNLDAVSASHSVIFSADAAPRQVMRQELCMQILSASGKPTPVQAHSPHSKPTRVMTTANAAAVDAYIAASAAATQAARQAVRATIREAAPDAEECISYGIPTYRQGKRCCISAKKRHVGLYATPTGHEAFVEELRGYKQGKGSVRFPLNRPMPPGLIVRIVRFRVAAVAEKAQASSFATSQCAGL